MPRKKYETEEQRHRALKEAWKRYNDKRPRKGGKIGRPKEDKTWWEKKTEEEKKEYYKKYDLKKHFNISLEQYKQMEEEQNHCCFICKIHKDNFPKKLSVDHDHTTGKIRGLLCNNCNTMLGYAKDNVYILQNAISYLELTKEVFNVGRKDKGLALNKADDKVSTWSGQN